MMIVHSLSIIDFVLSPGMDSEPFIMILLEEDLKQLLVSTNQRYLTEKNLEGHVEEMLDLKCLKEVTCREEEVIHANLIQGTELPVVRMKFDYVRKDRRKRVYVMESAQCAEVHVYNYMFVVELFAWIKYLL